jgi:hypothetical protein
MYITLIPKKDYHLIFQAIESYMNGAAKYSHGRYKTEDIMSALYSTNQQLWIAYEDMTVYGFVVTDFVQYPQIKALIMHFTGGKELPKWKNEMLEVLQSFAKVNGCNIIESYGRPGWARVFKDDGYKQKFIFYELPVE